MIVILAPENDAHALSVKRSILKLQPDCPVVIFDPSIFPIEAMLSVTPDSWELQLPGGSCVRSSDVLSVWWRRPGRHKIDAKIIDRGARRFAENECTHAFDAIIYWSDYVIVNPVEREIVASRKAIQLRLAREIGFRVPNTLITNSSGRATAFIDMVDGKAVFKTLTPPLTTFGETRRFTAQHRQILDTVAFSPVIFQEEISVGRHVRVTAIGSEIFATEIKVNNPTALQFTDWRLDVGATTAAIGDLPQELLEKIRCLLDRLGLLYGAFDFIEAVDGCYFFLELNPSGQFLFNEVDTGQPMSEAFGRLLLSRDVLPEVGRT